MVELPVKKSRNSVSVSAIYVARHQKSDELNEENV